MIIQQKYYNIMLCLLGCSVYAGVPNIPAADDLLAGCDQVQSAFKDDAQELLSLLSSLANVASVLNDVTQKRQNSFNGYNQQLLNYQTLLAQEQQKLDVLREQGLLEQADIKSKINTLNLDGTAQIETLQNSIASLQDAIKTLQENLTTISNLTQSRVDGVNAMVSSYGDFENVRLNFKDQLDVLLNQIRAYVGTIADQNSLLQAK